MCGIKMLCLGSRYSVIVYGIGILSFVLIDKGWSKIKMPHSFCVISMARNMPEGRDVIHSKGEIHSSVWSTKTFTYDIKSRDISKSKWGIRFQRFHILDNLVP